FGDIPPVAAQDTVNVLKQGYLEKKRKDHSFFGSEWQKRWCVLNNLVFYYFGSDKDKQQKGSFYISDYSVQLVTNLRKDSRKTSCFEFFAPGRRPFQFTAGSPQEAKEWVDQIKIVLRDLSSTVIPFDDEEEEEEEETYDDIEGEGGPPLPQPLSGTWGGGGDTGAADEEDEDIYEVLPEESPDSADGSLERNNKPAWTKDYANYYQGLWDCSADEPDELPFQRGDLIYIISKILLRQPGPRPPDRLSPYGSRFCPIKGLKGKPSPGTHGERQDGVGRDLWPPDPCGVLKTLASAAATSSSFSPSPRSPLPPPTKTRRRRERGRPIPRISPSAASRLVQGSSGSFHSRQRGHH
ncbi:Src kinase-associated phosphoprotein 1, partial [Takifugu flavidus]